MTQLYVNDAKILEEVDLVLFDKDGTLVDIHHYWTSMIKARASLIARRYMGDHVGSQTIEAGLVDVMGVDLESGRMKPDGPVGIKPRRFIVNVAAEYARTHNIEISDDDMEELFKEVDQQTSKDILPLLHLLPGAARLLDRLKQCGVAAAVVSTDITSRTIKSMEALEIEHYFCAILGGDAVKNTKPHPDLAILAMEQGQFAKEKTVVIGDHPVDMLMGNSAGVGANIGVLTGLSSMAAFEDCACHVAADLRSIEVK